MIDYTLPKVLEVAGKELSIRYDWRAILDCIVILNAEDLDEREKAVAFLEVFYVNPEEIEDYEEAIKKAMAFISNGTDDNQSKKEYMNWEHDFPMIIAPISRVAGKDIRELPELHWWSFLGYFMEIGECYWSSVVSIRVKKSNGKKLEKWEQEFYREHKKDIDLHLKYSKQEDDLFAELWGQIQ